MAVILSLPRCLSVLMIVSLFVASDSSVFGETGGNLDKGMIELHPAVEAFFGSDDPFIQETVIPNIDRYNRGDAELQILSSKGEPASGVEVHAKLVRHRFLFGCSAPSEVVEPGPVQDSWLGLWEPARRGF